MCIRDRYKIVVAPMLYMFRAGFEEKVRKFVENGGTFIMTYWSGVVDENDLCVLGGTPGGLMDVMGQMCIRDRDNSYQKFVTAYPEAFEDLTDSGIDFSQFPAGKLAYSTVDGKNYGVPFDNGAVIDVYKRQEFLLSICTDIICFSFAKLIDRHSRCSCIKVFAIYK